MPLTVYAINALQNPICIANHYMQYFPERGVLGAIECASCGKYVPCLALSDNSEFEHYINRIDKDVTTPQAIIIYEPDINRTRIIKNAEVYIGDKLVQTIGNGLKVPEQTIEEKAAYVGMTVEEYKWMIENVFRNIVV